MTNFRRFVIYASSIMIIAAIPACSNTSTPNKNSAPIDRESKIPPSAIKMSSKIDELPPVLLSGDYTDPIPIPGAVNTAGGEDSPFITPEGNALFFFFTPDVTIPANQQLLDGVTGIYESRLVEGDWSEPERIVLQDPGKQALDGCAFVLDNRMWFCSAREGYTGLNWFTADYLDGTWQNWQIADFNQEYEIGELHISTDGKELYFASGKSGGRGQLDIWVSNFQGGKWQEPVNVAAVNSSDSEGWPALSPDGNELWFARNYGIWRSEKVNGEWQAPEQIVSSLAGEPSVDGAGNLYFVHHYFTDGKMIEADIYVAYKK